MTSGRIGMNEPRIDLFMARTISLSLGQRKWFSRHLVLNANAKKGARKTDFAESAANVAANGTSNSAHREIESTVDLLSTWTFLELYGCPHCRFAQPLRASAH